MELTSSQSYYGNNPFNLMQNQIRPYICEDVLDAVNMNLLHDAEETLKYYLVRCKVITNKERMTIDWYNKVGPITNITFDKLEAMF